ncbi:hypothetical protein Tco_1139490, partial [Tanacetum coccineum]
RARDAYHNLQDDDIMKNIFNSGRNKNKVGMRILAWMITEEMKLTEHYKMTISAPRSPNPVTEPAEEIEKLVEESENVDDSSPPRHDDTSIPDTRLEPRNDKESPEVEIVQEKEEKTTPMVDVTNIVIPVNVDDEEDEITDEVFELRRRAKRKNVEETRISPIPSPTRSPRNLSTLTVTNPTPSSGSFAPKLTKTNRFLSLIKAKPNRFKRYKSFFHELQGRYGYLFAHLKKRFMPRTSSDQLADNLHDIMMETLPSLVKEKVTEQVKKEVLAQVRDQVPVYLAEVLILERKMTKEETERLISKAILQEHGRMQAQISSQIQNVIDNAIPSLVDAFADPLLQQQDIAIWLALQMKFEKTQVPQTACRSSAVCTRDQDDPYDDAHPEGENSAKRQKTSERANDCIVSITESDYKNLNKNDIEYMYLLIVNNKVPDYANTGLLWSLSVFIRSSVIWERVHDFQLGIESYQQKINLTAPIITFLGIEEYDVFSIVYEPVHGIIYTNRKKEKRMMRHTEIHKFCDATLRRTLGRLKSYYNDVKYGYVQKEFTDDEVAFLKLFEEEIEFQLNYQDQMR